MVVLKVGQRGCDAPLCPSLTDVWLGVHSSASCLLGRWFAEVCLPVSELQKGCQSVMPQLPQLQRLPEILPRLLHLALRATKPKEVAVLESGQD